MHLTDLPDRIAEKIMPTDDGCWLWTAGTDTAGYSQIRWNGPMRLAHRIVYELLVGPITEATLDHLCRVRSCVNPEHLEPVSLRVNILRGEGLAAKQVLRTHCPRNHPYDAANTYVNRGRRFCRECARISNRASKRRLRESRHAEAAEGR